MRASLAVAFVLAFVFPSGLRAQDKLEPEVEKFKARLGEAGGDRLRQDILAYVRTHAGSKGAVQASGLLNELPSPLDKLDKEQIPELDRFEWQPKELVAVLGEHRGRQGSPCTCVVWTPDGKRIVSGGHNGYVRIWDATTLREIARTSTGTYTTCMAVSRDSKTLAAGHVYGGLWVWDISGEKPVQTGHFQIGTSQVHSVDISADGKLLAAGVYDGMVHTFDLMGSKPKERTQLAGHKSAARSVQFAPSSKQLAAGATDGTVRFWNFMDDSVKELGSLEVHTAAISCMTYHSRGNQILAGTDDGHIIKVNLGAKFTRGSAHKTPFGITAINFSPGGVVTTAHTDGILRQWATLNVAMPKASLEIPGHFGILSDCAYSPDGRMIATCGHDWTIRQWQLAPRILERFPLKGHWSLVHRHQFAPDGMTIATGSEDRTARIWNLTKNAPTQAAQFNHPKENQPIWTVAHTPDGKTLATGGAAGIVRLWNLTRNSEIKALPPMPHHVNHLFFMPDGQRLLVGSHNKVLMWNTTTAREIFRFEGHKERINGMTLSGDGRYVLTGTGYYKYKDGKIVTVAGKYVYEDCAVRMWDTRDGKSKKEVTDLETPVSHLEFAPDGRTFACANWNVPSQIWEASLEGIKKIADIKNSSSYSHVQAFSPDGKIMATLGNDYKLRITEIATDKILKAWTMNEYIGKIAFTPDSRYLAVAIQTGPVYLLRLQDPPAGKSN